MTNRDPLKISLYSSIAVACILILAAFSKWLYPLPEHILLGKIAMVIDLLIALFAIVFHRNIIAWQILSLIFSFWLGYSFFWLIQNQSCGCFGSFGATSSGIAMGMDLLMIGLSWINMAFLGATKKRIFITILCAGLLVVFGFWLGAYIFSRPLSNPVPSVAPLNPAPEARL